MPVVTLRERLEVTSRARRTALTRRLHPTYTTEHLEYLRVFNPTLLPPTCTHPTCAHR